MKGRVLKTKIYYGIDPSVDELAWRLSSRGTNWRGDGLSGGRVDAQDDIPVGRIGRGTCWLGARFFKGTSWRGSDLESWCASHLYGCVNWRGVSLSGG